MKVSPLSDLPEGKYLANYFFVNNIGTSNQLECAGQIVEDDPSFFTVVAVCSVCVEKI